VQTFNNYGWLNYFLSLDAYNEDAAREFSRTFSEDEASIWGLTVVATDQRIVEVTGLPTDGENFSSDVISA
jgi:hypothetical protein